MRCSEAFLEVNYFERQGNSGLLEHDIDADLRA
jgi:hypothetical protein